MRILSSLALFTQEQSDKLKRPVSTSEIRFILKNLMQENPEDGETLQDLYDRSLQKDRVEKILRTIHSEAEMSMSF